MGFVVISLFPPGINDLTKKIRQESQKGMHKYGFGWTGHYRAHIPEEPQQPQSRSSTSEEILFIHSYVKHTAEGTDEPSTFNVKSN